MIVDILYSALFVGKTSLSSLHAYSVLVSFLKSCVAWLRRVKKKNTFLFHFPSFCCWLAFNFLTYHHVAEQCISHFINCCHTHLLLANVYLLSATFLDSFEFCNSSSYCPSFKEVIWWYYSNQIIGDESLSHIVLRAKAKFKGSLSIKEAVLHPPHCHCSLATSKKRMKSQQSTHHGCPKTVDVIFSLYYLRCVEGCTDFYVGCRIWSKDGYMAVVQYEQ